MTTHTVQTDGAAIVYDVHGPLPAVDGRPPLLMVGQPMDAGGFLALASRFPDRAVITYDPRGLGCSTRSDGRVPADPTVQAEDLHALIQELVAGAVEVFASSGGAISALALVTAHPHDGPLLSHASAAVPGYRPDTEALAASPTRIVVGVGEESQGTLTARTAVALAERLGQDAVVFPSHHGGFAGEETGWPGKPEEFAVRLREVLERV